MATYLRWLVCGRCLIFSKKVDEDTSFLPPSESRRIAYGSRAAVLFRVRRGTNIPHVVQTNHRCTYHEPPDYHRRHRPTTVHPRWLRTNPAYLQPHHGSPACSNRSFAVQRRAWHQGRNTVQQTCHAHQSTANVWSKIFGNGHIRQSHLFFSILPSFLLAMHRFNFRRENTAHGPEHHCGRCC